MTLVFIGCSLLSLVIIYWQRVIKVPHDGRNVTVVWYVTTPCGWVGPVVGGEDLNCVSQHTVSCGPCKDLILAFVENVKTKRKTHFSGEMLSNGISYVVIASYARRKPI